MQNNTAQKSILAFLVTGSLVLLNIVSLSAFTRCDLTHDKAFTLSDATKETMTSLKSPVKVTAYFTENLPPPFSDNARYVKDLLEEYRAASGGNVSFEFLDPMAQETQEDKAIKKEVKRDIFGRSVREKTSVETELEALGVQPVEVRVFEEDQAQTKRAYMGVVVRYGEQQEALPVVQDTSTLEYDLTTMVRRLVRTKQPVIGVVQGHGEPSVEQDLSKLAEVLKPNYELRAVTLGTDAVADDIDALLIIGPKQNYSDDELKAVDAFVMKGKAVGFFIDRQNVDYQSFQATPIETNVDQLVAAYGVEVGSQLVGDVDCASLSVQEKRGFMTIQMPLKYPFIPMPKALEGDSPMTKGIADITLPFAVPLYPKTVDGVEIKVLAKSSAKSWIEDASPETLNPRRDYNTAQIGFTGPYNLIAQARGTLPSFADGSKKSSAEARMIVMGTAGVLNPAVMGPQNVGLLMNAIDWLSLDSKLLAMRTRGQSEVPFSADLSDTTRTVVKVFNIAGVPVLLVLYGVIRWRLREARRRRLVASAP